jgi:hypothetical protein
MGDSRFLGRDVLDDTVTHDDSPLVGLVAP